MAVKNYTAGNNAISGGTLSWTWTLANGDTGSPVPVADAYGPWLASVVSGTLGTGGNIRWEGSVDGGSTWFTLTSEGSTALNMNALNTNKPVWERPLLVRPNATAGDGSTSLLCSLVTRR